MHESAGHAGHRPDAGDSRNVGLPAAVEQLCDEILARRDQRRRDQADRIYRAMMLAPRIEVCEALLRGESVPLKDLDPIWVERFGFKAAA